MPLRGTFGALGARALGKATIIATPSQISWENATGTWTVPEGVESICAVAVGKGGTYTDSGGPGAGALSYRNNISVTPGEVLTYSCTGDAYLQRGTDKLILAKAGSNSNGEEGGAGGKASDGIGDVKHSGGAGGDYGFDINGPRHGGSGGAAGYAGDGGKGGEGGSGGGPGTGSAGQGGGGGGGSGGWYDNTHGWLYGGCGGGGVGLLGQGDNGAAGGTYGGGKGGSSGGNGTAGSNGGSDGNGGKYGGGGETPGAAGLRIIWGAGRAFPSTNTGNV